MRIYNKPLFIFEMANNHQGSVEHGKNIIGEIAKACEPYKDYFNFGFKFQYRNLDTFIHPNYKNRTDIKNVKRFMDTKLTKEQFKVLKDELKKYNFFSICTAFDEASVQLIKEHEYDVIKIASCSFTDWPLLEEIVKINKPVIASTAGSELKYIDKVVQFFLHRNIDLSLMHCVAEYPTKPENLQLNQIDLLKNRYNLRTGYSTHESPDNFESIKIAISKGASIFEKHIGVPNEEITLNAYSANPEQVKEWLKAAYNALVMCGRINQRYEFTEKEKSDLAALKRGVFAKKKIVAGEKVDASNVFFAFPCTEGQLLADDISKYNEFYLKDGVIEENGALMLDKFSKVNTEDKIQNKVNKIVKLLKDANVVIPLNSECEISHHYGLDEFEVCGATIISCINREYCKKIMVILPGQSHPKHYHKLKEETFNVLYGDLKLNLNGNEQNYVPGESVVVERGVIHSFASESGCVFEEISTTHFVDDSFYEDEKIKNNQNRKTKVYLTKQLLDKVK